MISMVRKKIMEIQVLLKNSETKNEKNFFCNKWLSMNEYVA
jgi:hypothetical protein